jgi:hypothetical protein
VYDKAVVICSTVQKRMFDHICALRNIFHGIHLTSTCETEFSDFHHTYFTDFFSFPLFNTLILTRIIFWRL